MTRALLFTALLIPASLLAQQARGVISLGPPVSPALIAAMEQKAATNPADMETRAQLLRLYAAAAPLQRTDYRIARLNHIRYLIEEAPAGSLAGSPLAFVASANGPYADPVDHNAMAALWIAQANGHFDDPKVLLNAVRFLGIEDKPRAESLFAAAIAARPADAETSARLGFFYAAGLVAADSGWTDHCRNELDRGSSPHVLMGAAIALPNLAMRQTGGGPAYESWVRYAEDLRRRATAMDPAGAGSPPTMPVEFGLFASDSEAAEQPPAPLAGALSGPVTIPSNVQASLLISNTAPAYPSLAIQAGVQGVVRLQAMIGPDGKINNLQLLSGPPLLAQAAVAAVQTWTYRPTILNGAPVAVSTVIEVPFTLPAR